jgi:hypothetical protein
VASPRRAAVEPYRQRSLIESVFIESVFIESVFSATKRKISARASGRSAATQQRQALLLGVTFNLYRHYAPSVITGRF